MHGNVTISALHRGFFRVAWVLFLRFRPERSQIRAKHEATEILQGLSSKLFFHFRIFNFYYLDICDYSTYSADSL